MKKKIALVALAAAAVGALYGPELVANTRFLSCLARLLAGSGCRSAAGGLALWGRSADAIARTIRHGIRSPGHAGTRGGIMPAFKTNAAEFSDDEVRELVEIY